MPTIRQIVLAPQGNNNPIDSYMLLTKWKQNDSDEIELAVKFFKNSFMFGITIVKIDSDLVRK